MVILFFNKKDIFTGMYPFHFSSQIHCFMKKVHNTLLHIFTILTCTHKTHLHTQSGTEIGIHSMKFIYIK